MSTARPVVAGFDVPVWMSRPVGFDG